MNMRADGPRFAGFVRQLNPVGVVDNLARHGYPQYMRRFGRSSEPGPIIIVQQIREHEWIMKLPRLTEEVHDRLDEGIDSIGGDPKHAASIFRELIEQYPEHMDAYHHLALTWERAGRKEAAFQAWKSAVDMALKFFPDHFSMERDRLRWGFGENRPFLRLYHSYGLQLWERGQTEDALKVFENLLSLNPNDNQGARAPAIGCYLELKKPKGVMSVCRLYPKDGLDHVLYGKALALFQLGKTKQAGKALDNAIKWYPLIAAELLKARHRRPKNMSDNYVTMGGPDQAYVYWQDHGKYWEHTPGAIEFLRRRQPGKGREGE